MGEETAGYRLYSCGIDGCDFETVGGPRTVLFEHMSNEHTTTLERIWWMGRYE
jgi:hypothetical protein